ncbi:MULTISPECIES: hypothetical protein [Paenibacillus]|uniref:hypothetical protein n=1 Tax=Paenibacillus TaxID=44249 RepID=UPI0022B8BC6D|nr:hypothetical protein [Paenibacillus caseinilyticus]MCZ8519480.1 hypothetical protein [Paenibacillus caseinilyticus]
MPKPNGTLQSAWLIPNVFMYILLCPLTVFVLINAEDLSKVNRLGIWVTILISLLIVALIGSYRIWSWIKQGKI